MLLGNGTSGFKPAPDSPLSTGEATSSLAVADFNSDGRSDIATATYLFDGIDEWDSVTVLLGNGGGGFSQAAGSPYAIKKSSLPQASDPIFNAASVVAADFNGDGRDVLAVTGSQTGGVTVLLGRCR